MASASFVEIISHFAGYLQIFHDIARDRLQYDETLAPGRSDDYTTLRPNYNYPFTPDDLDTRGGPVPTLIADDPMDVFRGRPLKLARDSQHPDDDDFSRPPMSPKVPLPASGGGGGGHVEHHITVKYEAGGEETQLTVHQHNFMVDNDTNLSPEALAAVEPLIAALNSDAMTTIEHLVADANAEIPANWWMTQNDGGAAEFVTAHDAAWAERGGTPDEHSVPPAITLTASCRSGQPSRHRRPSSTTCRTPATGSASGRRWAAMKASTQR